MSAYPAPDHPAQLLLKETLGVAIIMGKRRWPPIKSSKVERSAKLSETIASRERFSSYSLSHHRPMPGRTMRGFSQIREGEYGSQLEEQGRNYLKGITSAAGRPDQLILEMLRHTFVVRENVRLKVMQVAPLLRRLGMFDRMHPASHYAGTGIGLTILRKAAEWMGGIAGVDSALGHGSAFWIQLNQPLEGALPS